MFRFLKIILFVSPDTVVVAVKWRIGWYGHAEHQYLHLMPLLYFKLSSPHQSPKATATNSFLKTSLWTSLFPCHHHENAISFQVLSYRTRKTVEKKEPVRLSQNAIFVSECRGKCSQKHNKDNTYLQRDIFWNLHTNWLQRSKHTLSSSQNRYQIKTSSCCYSHLSTRQNLSLSYPIYFSSCFISVWKCSALSQTRSQQSQKFSKQL